MHTVKQGIAWAKSPAAEKRDGKSWGGWCQSYVFRFSGATRSAKTAYLAFKGSGPVQSKNPEKAPAGAFHWWSDSGAGHVAISLGKGEAAMASAAVTTRWGVDQGTINVRSYSAKKPGLTYLGWTFDMLGQMMVDVEDYVREQEAKEKDAADAAKKAKAAAAKKAEAERVALNLKRAQEAAAKVAAEKAAEAKKKADAEAQEKALHDAAEASVPVSEVQATVLLVREVGAKAVYLLQRDTKTHLDAAQYKVYRLLGARVTEVPAGALASFREVGA